MRLMRWALATTGAVGRSKWQALLFADELAAICNATGIAMGSAALRLEDRPHVMPLATP